MFKAKLTRGALWCFSHDWTLDLKLEIFDHKRMLPTLSLRLNTYFRPNRAELCRNRAGSTITPLPLPAGLGGKAAGLAGLGRDGAGARSRVVRMIVQTGGRACASCARAGSLRDNAPIRMTRVIVPMFVLT
jgi:hypothetical protein